MSKYKGILGIIAVIIIAGIAIIFLFQKQIGTSLFERAAQSRVGVSNLDGLPDGLHVGLCGTGSPLPDPNRAGPCNIVIAGKAIFVVDIGEGGARNLNLMGLGADVDALLLTHFHSDHIDGMGPLLLGHWVGGAQSPLPVYGPQGVEEIVDGFNIVYANDARYRIAHHGEKILTPSGKGAIAKPFTMKGETQIILKNKDLTITAFTVGHEPVSPAIGYRFDYKGRSVVISGDTVKSASLERAAKDADILVHEALQPKMVKTMQSAFKEKEIDNMAKIMADILDYHASPEEAAQSAKAAGVKQLVFSHIVPIVPNRYFYPVFLGDAAKYYDGPMIMGEDGMIFTLPANSDSIEYGELL